MFKLRSLLFYAFCVITFSAAYAGFQSITELEREYCHWEIEAPGHQIGTTYDSIDANPNDGRNGHMRIRLELVPDQVKKLQISENNTKWVLPIYVNEGSYTLVTSALNKIKPSNKPQLTFKLGDTKLNCLYGNCFTNSDGTAIQNSQINMSDDSAEGITILPPNTEDDCETKICKDHAPSVPNKKHPFSGLFLVDVDDILNKDISNLDKSKKYLNIKFSNAPTLQIPVTDKPNDDCKKYSIIKNDIGALGEYIVELKSYISKLKGKS